MQQDDITVFLQVVACGSLTRASKLMFRPKATLSHQLKRLEQELGTQLFDRRLGRLALNEAGQGFVPHAEAIQAACLRGRDAAKTARLRSDEEISIATSVEFASNIVSSIFLDFAAQATDIRFSAMSFPRDVLPEVCDLFDCTLYLGKPMAPSFQKMQARRLGSFRYALYASPAYLEKHGVPTHPDDLSGHKMLVRREHSEPQVWRLHSPLGTVDVEPAARLMSNDPWVIKIAATRHQGIGFLPDFFTAMEVANGLLCNVLPQWQSEEVPLNALYASHRSGNQQLGEMLDYAALNFGKLGNYLYRAEA